MKLVSRDGAIVELSPVRYEFGTSGTPRDWDANWLVVTGSVSLPQGQAWTFEDACLTAWEARELADWLRGVGSGQVQPSVWDLDEARLLVFTEPNLAFSVAARTEDSVAVRVHLSLELGPPSEKQELFEYFVVIDLSLSALADALRAWESELQAFPVR